jgi:chromate transporter
MVAYIRRLAVDKKGWLGAEAFSDGVALCQMIPGATAMQTAAFVGLQTRGIVGAGASFIAFGLPAFVMMVTFAALYTRTHSLAPVVSAFSGLQAITVAIVVNAALSFGRATLRDWRTSAIAVVAAVLFTVRFSPFLVIVLSAIAGWAIVRRGQPARMESTGRERAPSYARPVLLILSLAAIGFALLFVFDRHLFQLTSLLSRIDLFAFGGGFASVPLMFHEIVEARHWMDYQTFMNGIILGQITPGPIVITATFIGYLLDGPLGGLIATIGMFLPSFVVLVGIAPYFARLRSSPPFHRIIGGVLCSFVGLLAAVTIGFGSNVQWDLARALLAGGALAALLLKVDILWVVLVGAAISLMVFRS